VRNSVLTVKTPPRRLPGGYRRFKSQRERHACFFWVAFQTPLDVAVRFVEGRSKPRGDDPYIEGDIRPAIIVSDYLDSKR